MEAQLIRQFTHLGVLLWICMMGMTAHAVSPKPTPLHIDYDLIFVDVLLNGKGPYRLLLDTGSQATYLSDNTLQSLSLKPRSSDTTLIETANDTAPKHGQQYVVETLSIGAHNLSAIPIRQLDALDQNSGLFKTLKVDGLLGMNALQSFVVTLDIAKKHLFLQTGTSETPSSKAIPFSQNKQLPIIAVTLKQGGEQTVTDFLIDTGYTGAFKMPFCIKADNQPQEQTPTNITDVFQQSAASVKGVFKGEIQIGDFIIESPQVLYPMDCEKPSDWGLIGNQWLQNTIVQINFPAKEISVTGRV